LDNKEVKVMGEWKQAFDRIMDQLYNHPEEMRARLLSKYENPSGKTEARPQTAIEMLRSMR
jgi:hypothetical protein